MTGEGVTASITVTNSNPSAPEISITPTDPESDESLTCTVDAISTDEDSDTITYTTSWTRDGEAMGTEETIYEGIISAGEVWECTVTPYDGEVYGPSDSASVTVTAPVLTEVCSDNLLSVGTPTIEKTVSTSTGNWGPDHHVAGDSGFWVFRGTDDDYFEHYSSMSASVDIGYDIEEDWAGTGQIIFDGHAYYVEQDTSELVKFDLETESEVTRASLSGVSTAASYYYWWSGHSSTDLDTDGDELMLIHSSPGAGGKFQVSKIHPGTLAVLSTWTAPSGLKSDYANAFIACGVLYAMPLFYPPSTTISYAWEIGTSSVWDPGIDWDVMSYLTSTQYSSVDDTIYVYDGGNLMTLSPTWGP
jgi:hypothetical protein